MNYLPPYVLVFDVESIGLYGSPFAVGGVAFSTAHLDQPLVFEEEFLYACPSAAAVGNLADRHWVEQNVQIPEAQIKLARPEEVQRHFWQAWLGWRMQDTWLAADCPFPVETAFLARCVEQMRARGESPYPLIDIGSVILSAGRNPLATYPRLPNEQPAHNPLADAKQSARLLVEAWQRLSVATTAPLGEVRNA